MTNLQSHVHHQPIAALPDLRIVPIENVLPHEEHDHQRSEPLIERIKAMGIWLNPPIVTPIGKAKTPEDQQYAVLDGANRTYCIRAMGYPHVLVQVVDYHNDQVTLETWNHVLSDVEVDDFLPAIYKIDGLHVEAANQDTAEAALDLDAALAYIRILPSRFLILVADQADVYNRSRKLRDIVATYKHVAELNRVDHDDPEAIRRLYPTAAAVVVFPHYEPVDILDAAREEQYLPPGISRHIIQGRAMRLHYPLDALADKETSLEQKNENLKRWMQERAAEKRIRLYEESTYVFDD